MNWRKAGPWRRSCAEHSRFGRFAWRRYAHRSCTATGGASGERPTPMGLALGRSSWSAGSVRCAEADECGIVALTVIEVAGGWLADPTLPPALCSGLGTVAFPFSILQPSLGLGIATARSPNPIDPVFGSLELHRSWHERSTGSAMGIGRVLHRIYACAVYFFLMGMLMMVFPELVTKNAGAQHPMILGILRGTGGSILGSTVFYILLR